MSAKCQRCGVKDYEPSIESSYCEPCRLALEDVRALVRAANPWLFQPLAVLQRGAAVKIDLTEQPGEYLKFEEPASGLPWSALRNTSSGEVIFGPVGHLKFCTGLTKEQVDTLVEFLSQS